MLQVNFADVLWKKQKQYIQEMGNYFGPFNAFRDIFNYFERGQAVAQIACGSILDDLFLTMERVGREGRIILIDEDPSFVYNRAVKILGSLPREKKFYTETEEGKQLLAGLFSQANVEAYIQHLPPYPEQIADESLDHVMAINAAFELMGMRVGGKPPDVEGLIIQTYRKLRRDGDLIVQGLMGDDTDYFRMYVDRTSGKNGLRFEEDYQLPSLREFGAGYWARWIKR